MIFHMSKTREVASILHARWIIDGAEEPPHLIEIDLVYPQCTTDFCFVSLFACLPPSLDKY